MSIPTIGLIVRSAVVAVVALIWTASPARAQAWLPAQGESTVSFIYQDAFVKYHDLPGTGEIDRGHIFTHALLLDFTYGLKDKIAIGFSIPFVASRYSGSFPHTMAGIPLQYQIPYTPIDTGAYHPAFQDYRFDLKYNLTEEGVVLTPVIAYIMPSHDYEFYGHSAIGRGLTELQTGLAAAKMFHAGLPGLFVQGQYAYGFTEKVLGVSHNRSLINAETGYFFTDRFRLMALGAGQVTHGGPDITVNWKIDLGPLAPHHDQVTRDNFLNLGGAAAYSLSDTLELYGSLMRTITARNGHIIDHAFALGVTWSFSPSRSTTHAFGDTGDSKQGNLVKCVCEKGAGMQ